MVYRWVRNAERGRGQNLWATSGRTLRISLGRYATFFQAEIHAVFPFVYEIQTNARSEKCISICSKIPAALKALQTAKTIPPSHGTAKGSERHFHPPSCAALWGPGHSGIHENETAKELTREGSVHQFVRLQPALGISRQNIKKKMKC